MKLYDLSLLIMACFVIGAAIIGVVSVKTLGDHNPVEKESEKVIQDETGVTVDLDYNDYMKSKN